MSDVDKLLSRFSTGLLLRPSPEVPNLIDLSRALLLLSGAEGIQPTPGSAALAQAIGPADHLVFIMADGLGMNFIEGLPPDTFLATHLAAELRTVFPSTTAVALTSIATGRWPGEHAVTGWWTHLQEIQGAAAMLPYLERASQRSLNHLGVSAEQAFPLPSVMGSTPRDTLALFPERVADSAYSVYFCGGGARRGYRNLREAIDALLARVAGADRPTFSYLYTPRIDDVAHRYGTSKPEVRAALIDLDRELERLAARLDRRGRIVLSADHGFLDVSGGMKYQIRPSDPLMAWLRFPPSGDARVLYLHLRHGACSQVFRHFQERFGERFLLITRAEAEGLGLFGPGSLSPAARKRLGDLIAISSGPDVIEYRPAGGAGKIAHEVSHHSGLTPAEMRVPLVVA